LNKKIAPLLIIMALVIGITTPVWAQSVPKPVIVAHVKGALEPDVAFQAIMDNITYIDWQFVTGELTPADIEDAVMLILILPDVTASYTAGELSAISSWLDEGGKTLWVTGNSDFGSDYNFIDQANFILEGVGSVLRNEHNAVEDPVSMAAGGSYRVLSVTEHASDLVKSLTVGVNRVLTHSPGTVTAYAEGRYWKLEDEQPENVYILLTTTETGIMFDHNPPVPEVHEAGDEGIFVTMAVEVDYENRNFIMFSSERPFGGYMPMYYPELIRPDRYADDVSPQQGGRFFTNIVNFATTFRDQILHQQALNRALVIYYAAQFNALNNTISDIRTKVAELEEENTILEEANSELEDQVNEFEDQVANLNTEVTSLEGQVDQLEGQIDSIKGQTSTWQMAAVGLLIVGLALGVVIGRMMKK
jgi:hypothetical protein